MGEAKIQGGGEGDVRMYTHNRSQLNACTLTMKKDEQDDEDVFAKRNIKYFVMLAL